MTRRYVEDTRVDPALNPSTVVERVKELEQQAKAVEEVAPTPVPTVPPKASSMPVGSPAAATSDLKRVQRAVADCDRILSEMHTEDPCVSLDSQSRLAWWGHQIGEPVDMRVCLIGAPEPFDFRLVDPRTGATTLLSLTAVNGVATATTRSGYCSGIVKVLLAPDAVRSVGNLYGNAVSVRVRGTYEGLYPLRQFVTGMEAEPTRLLIHAIRVQRQAQQR